MYKRLIISILGISLFVTACSHYDEIQKNAKESMAGDDESHNSGQNCMSCHNKGGNSEAVREGGWWNIAGTAYQSGRVAREGSVELWTGPNRTGSLIYKLTIDELGNFYTGKIVNFRGGVFPILVDKNGNMIKAMQSSTLNGACNSCHGVSTAVISFN
jgi:cytochrome c553